MSAFGRVLAASLLCACGSDPALECPDGYRELPDLANCYRGDATQLSWVNARAACADEGAFLAIPDGGYEALATTTIAQNAGVLDPVWVGLSDLDEEDVWVTVLGDVAAFLPFASIEPNGGTNANCMRIDKNAEYTDDACTDLHEFVCEFPR